MDIYLVNFQKYITLYLLSSRRLKITGSICLVGGGVDAPPAQLHLRGRGPNRHYPRYERGRRGPPQPRSKVKESIIQKNTKLEHSLLSPFKANEIDCLILKVLILLKIYFIREAASLILSKY